jgi:transcriptional regulator with XRE-family HTH domain
MEFTGDDLRRLRIKSGVNQSQLADKLKVDRKTVHNWETGTSQPTANQFFKICLICNINALLLVTRLASRKSADTPIDTSDLNRNENN